MGLTEKIKEIFGVEDEPEDNIYYVHMMERLDMGNTTEIEERRMKKQVSQLIRDNCSTYKEPEDE